MCLSGKCPCGSHYAPLQWYMGALCTIRPQYAPPSRNVHHSGFPVDRVRMCVCVCVCVCVSICNPTGWRLQPTCDSRALVNPPPMSSCHRILEPYSRWHATIYTTVGCVYSGVRMSVYLSEKLIIILKPCNIHENPLLEFWVSMDFHQWPSMAMNVSFGFKDVPGN